MYKLLYFFLLSFFFIEASVMPKPFSFIFPEEVNKMSLRAPEYLKASDGIDLAFYKFVPTNAQKIMIFYHGAGAWSGCIYQYMAKQLMENHKIGTYLFDIRGHGNSHGPRGDAPSVEHVWHDVSTAVDFAKKNHPHADIFLAGHSSGAGLVLNYSLWHKNPSVNGYLFLAPYLGSHSNTSYEHTNPSKRFIKSISYFPLITHILSGGYFFKHTPVIFFNYPESEKNNDLYLLDYYTNIMIHATGPSNAKVCFEHIDRPFSLLIGADDEQFIPEKTVAYANYAPAIKSSSALILPNTRHLSIVLDALDVIASKINTLSRVND